MRYEVKRIAIWPFIKVSFFINLLIGFIFGLFYSPIVSVIMLLLTATPFYSSQGVESAPASWGALLFIIPFISAFLAGCVNTLVGLVLVLAYNMFAVMLGGLEFEMDPVRPDVPPPAVRPIERPTTPTIYAASGDDIVPPPPPPPPVGFAAYREEPSAPSTQPDVLEDTGRVPPPAPSAASERPEQTHPEPGESFAARPEEDHEDGRDDEGRQV